jgi:hypothetical protein
MPFSTFLFDKMSHFFPAGPLLSIFCKAEKVAGSRLVGQTTQSDSTNKKPQAASARG